jgi:hypothetical protein
MSLIPCVMHLNVNSTTYEGANLLSKSQYLLHLKKVASTIDCCLLEVK